MQRLQLAVIGFWCATLVATSAGAAFATEMAPAALRGTMLGRVSPATPIDLMISLRGQHQTEIDRLIVAQNTPGSAYYKRYLSPQEFGRYFGASDRDYAAAVGALRAAGFTIDEAFENRTDIEVHASAARVEAFFRTPLDVRAERGRIFFTARYRPQLPADGAIESVVGLDDYLQRKPHHYGVAATSPSPVPEGWNPAAIESAYDLTPIYAQHEGEGVTVIDATVGTVRPTDFTIFNNYYGLHASLSQIGQKNRAPIDDNGESTLDVQWMAAIAPKVKTLLVSPVKNDNAGFEWMYAFIVNKLAQHHIVSTSWGSCEQDNYLFGAIENNDKLFRQAELEGQWWMSAAGDWGSDDCQETSGGIPAVDYPGSSKHVMSVGGTALAPASIASRQYTGWGSEIVWNGGPTCGAGGGGVSTLFTRPAFQNPATTSYMREVPDVVLMADWCDLGGYFWVFKGKLLGGEGGTSFAAPEWAGFLALIESRYGKTPISDPKIRLYALGTSASSATLFHNVVLGCNTYYDVPGYCAHAGYSPAGGLGSPIGSALYAAY